MGALGGWVSSMFVHSQEEEQRKEAEILENERKRLWEEQEERRKQEEIDRINDKIDWKNSHNYKETTPVVEN